MEGFKISVFLVLFAVFLYSPLIAGMIITWHYQRPILAAFTAIVGYVFVLTIILNGFHV